MSAGHTPGPWAVRFTKKLTPQSPDIPRHIVGADGDIVVTFNSANPRFGDEKRANARLIAAAPKLLEALEKLVAAVNTNELAAAMACHSVASFANVEDALKPALAILASARGAA